MEELINTWRKFKKEWDILNAVSYGDVKVTIKRPQFDDFIDWLARQ